MLKALVYSGLVILTFAEVQHPINEDVVNDIKQKTDKWHPHEV